MSDIVEQAETLLLSWRRCGTEPLSAYIWWGLLDELKAAHAEVERLNKMINSRLCDD